MTKNKSGRKQLKRRYDHVANPDKLDAYDGRGNGVDVYTCKNCGYKIYTRYKDKGVTPFVLFCPECTGCMQHDNTISEEAAAFMSVKVENWVRPPFEWLLKHRKNERLIEHILQGGLLRESEL